jgi:DNA-binding transcriptional LysR family regulator
VNTRHFGKAAENLYLTQSAVGARIKLLEEYFNTPLFIRQRNSLQLTLAGERLIPFAQAMAAQLSNAREALNETDINYLALAATPNAASLYFSMALIHFTQSFRGLKIRAETLGIEQITRQLHERILDIAFSLEPVKSDEVESKIIKEYPLALCRLTDVANSKSSQIQHVHVEWSLKISELICQYFDGMHKAILRTNSLDTALNYIKHNGGYLVVPISVAEACGQDFEIVEQREDLILKVYINYMKDIRQSSLEEFILFFQSEDSQGTRVG